MHKKFIFRILQKNHPRALQKHLQGDLLFITIHVPSCVTHMTVIDLTLEACQTSTVQYFSFSPEGVMMAPHSPVFMSPLNQCIN